MEVGNCRLNLGQIIDCTN